MIVYGTDPERLRPDRHGVDELRHSLGVTADRCHGARGRTDGTEKGIRRSARARSRSRRSDRDRSSRCSWETATKWATWQALGREPRHRRPRALGGQRALRSHRRLLQRGRHPGDAGGDRPSRRAERLRARRHELREAGGRIERGGKSAGDCRRRDRNDRARTIASGARDGARRAGRTIPISGDAWETPAAAGSTRSSAGPHSPGGTSHISNHWRGVVEQDARSS